MSACDHSGQTPVEHDAATDAAADAVIDIVTDTAADTAADVPVPPAPTYDTTIGNGVDENGFTELPLRAGAHRYFVDSATGSDSNGCTAAQNPATPLATLGAGVDCVAQNAGDQVLFAEGSTYSSTWPWVAFKGGYSAQYPTVFQSYDPADALNEAKYGRGDQRGARPVFTAVQPQISNGTFANIVFRGFDFNPGNGPDQGFILVGHGSNILVENNLFRYTGLSYDSSDAQNVTPTAQHFVVRGNSFYGEWSTGGRTGGLYVAGVDAVSVEDNVFWHAGWRIGGSRDDDYTVGGATVFSHSFYLQTNTTNGIVRRNLSMDGAGDGGIARGDINFSENLSIDNPACVGLGGGPAYGTDRPSGVSIQASDNACFGDADTNSSHRLGWGINTANGIAGSRVHHNLLARTRDPLSDSVQGFSTGSFFAQPSYTDYDHNVLWHWGDGPQNTYWTDNGTYAAYTHVTYSDNVWHLAGDATNVNDADYHPPSPYTAAELYAALGFADKDAFTAFAIEHPEQRVGARARALLFAGYGL